LPGAVGRSAVFGCAVGFVAALNLVRYLRPALLLDPETSWAIPRLLLGLTVIAVAASVGGISAAGVFRWTRSSLSVSPLPRLPFSFAALASLAAIAFLMGSFARLASLDSIPEALWVDDVSEIAPALDLSGQWRDFADSIRPVPFGQSPRGMVGVLYLEFFRLILLLFGTNTFSLRLPAAIAGVVSLVTTGLLARRVLPRGGATLAVVVLAGLYWNVTMSRLDWVALVIAPIVSLATLLRFRARDRPTPILALCAGALIGIGAHVYLAAWVAAAGLLAIAFWPSHRPLPVSGLNHFLLPAFFVLGFCLAVSPLFLFREGRTTPYFLRARIQSLLHDVRSWRSPQLLFEAASDGMSAARAWCQNVELRLVFRDLLAVAFLRALRRPRDELSMIILAQAGAALAATVLDLSVPNGFRFGYLSDVTAIESRAEPFGLCCWSAVPAGRFSRRQWLGWSRQDRFSGSATSFTISRAVPVANAPAQQRWSLERRCGGIVTEPSRSTRAWSISRPWGPRFDATGSIPKIPDCLRTLCSMRGPLESFGSFRRAPPRVPTSAPSRSCGERAGRVLSSSGGEDPAR